MERSIFDKKLSRQEYLDKYPEEKTKNMITCSLSAYDFYRKMRFNDISDEHYISELIKLDETSLYRELDRLKQFLTTEGNKLTYLYIKKNSEKLKNAVHPKEIAKLEEKLEGLEKRKGLSYSATKSYLNFIFAWFRLNGIKIDPFMLKQNVKLSKPLKEKPKPLDDETLENIIGMLSPKYKTYYMFVCVTGVRLAKEALSIRVKDIDFESDPIKITLPAKITKTKTERITFAIRSVAKELKLYNIQGKTPEDRVFDFEYSAFYGHFARIRKQLGLTERNANGWNYKINPYKARKRARTKLSSIDKDFGEAIIGHSDISNTYYEKSDEEMAEIYKQAESVLSLSRADRYKHQAETLQDEIKHRKSQDAVIEELKEEIARLKILTG